MNQDREEKNDRPEAYPQPTETDKQLKNQPEYIDQQPNEFHDRTLNDIPAQRSNTETPNESGS